MDPNAPHAPYINAVTRALGGCAEVEFVEHGGTEARNVDQWLLIAVIAPDGPDEDIDLAWTSDDGWTWGIGTGLWDRTRHLPVDTYATPAAVAAALNAARTGVEPVTNPDHDTHPDPPAELPTQVAKALADGDIDETAARILAAYWPRPVFTAPGRPRARITYADGSVLDFAFSTLTTLEPTRGQREMHLGGWIPGGTNAAIGRQHLTRAETPDGTTYRHLDVTIDVSGAGTGENYVAVTWDI